MELKDGEKYWASGHAMNKFVVHRVTYVEGDRLSNGFVATISPVDQMFIALSSLHETKREALEATMVAIGDRLTELNEKFGEDRAALMECHARIADEYSEDKKGGK